VDLGRQIFTTDQRQTTQAGTVHLEKLLQKIIGQRAAAQIYKKKTSQYYSGFDFGSLPKSSNQHDCLLPPPPE